MRKLNCRPGDLAIVVEALNTCNIGTIVQVLHKHHNQRAVCANPDDHVWMVEAPYPMAYEYNRKLIYTRKGGAPDSGLQPIRGLPLGKDITDHLRDKYEMENFDLRIFEVSDSGTISDPDVEAPKINADLFQFDDHHTVDSLIYTIETCTKDFDESWIDFLNAWDNVKHPLGSSMTRIASGLPDHLITNDASIFGNMGANLLELCIRLDENQKTNWNDEPFPLACRIAGDVLGINRNYANNLLSLLTKEGFLELVTKGNTAKANKYRINPKFRRSS